MSEAQTRILELFRELHERHDIIGVPAASTVERAEQAHRLANGELIGQLRLLQCDAQPRSQGICLTRPLHAEHDDFAVVRHQQSLADLDRGRFAGPIRSQQAEAFAGAHCEIQTIHRHHFAIALPQTAHE